MLKFKDKEQEAIFNTAKDFVEKIDGMLKQVENNYNTFEEVLDLYNLSIDDFNKFVSVCCLLQEKSGTHGNSSTALVSDLGVPVRTINALRKRGVLYVNQLLCLSYKEISRTRNIGKKSLINLVDILKEEYGYQLKGSNLDAYNRDVYNLQLENGEI